MTRILVLGALLLALPLLGVLARWVAVHLFGKAIGRHAVEKQPDRIRLSNAPSDAWKQPAAASALAHPLLAAGFEDAGSFTIAEMPGVVVRLLVHPLERQSAVIYEHPRGGTWLELTTRYADGSIASFSTLPPTGLKPLRGHTTVNAPGLAPEALHARAMAERPPGMMTPVARDRAVWLFEEGYAEAIAARKRAGVSAAEVAAVARHRKAA